MDAYRLCTTFVNALSIVSKVEANAAIYPAKNKKQWCVLANEDISRHLRKDEKFETVGTINTGQTLFTTKLGFGVLKRKLNSICLMSY